MQALSLDNKKKRCNEFITKIKATDKINALPIGYLAGT